MYMMLVPRRDFDLFDDFFNDSFFKGGDKHSHPLMKTDIKETDDAYILDIDLPGFNKENIQIDVENGYLNITAKNSSSFDEENEKFIRKERYSGECSRSFYIGEDVNEDDIKASFKNGILNLNVPKTKEDENKPEKQIIEIND